MSGAIATVRRTGLVSCLTDSSAVDGGLVEDGVGGFRPDERSWMVVSVGEAGPDVAFDGLDRAVDAAAEPFLTLPVAVSRAAKRVVVPART
ncbi:hypothetical protein ACFVYV_39050 [Streptomyces mirabilis]|jgi:hypothetical protein|uniref:hypothetical protein n=1 Tax=Streptomyces mirabilis TaxID=68239 RepID=UPI0036D9D129